MKHIPLIATALMLASTSLPSIHKPRSVGPTSQISAAGRRRQAFYDPEVRRLRATQSAEIQAWNAAVEAKKQAKKNT